MGNISKKAGGPIRADEVGWEGLKKNPKADADAALLDLALGGGVSKPIPVFSGETISWTIYSVTSTEDDDKPGIYCLAVFDMPHDSMGLKLKYCYVKNDGTYGRVHWFPSYRLDDEERSAGRVEVQFGPLRPNSRIDIVRAVAVKRAAKDVGNPALDEEDRRGKGTTPAYTPEAIPSTIGIGAYWGDYDGAANDQPFANRIRFTSGPNALATILTKNYIISSPRILDVGSPKKEVDGIYFPVTFGVTNSAELLTASIRMGIYRVGTKAGGATAYSKRIPVPRYDLSEEDRDTLNTANQLTIDVGPLKANKRYHIRWARARYSLDPDDSGAKTIRVRHPVEYFASGTTPPDLSLNYISTATVDGNGSQWSRNNVTSVDPDGALIAIPGNDTGTSPNPSPNTTSGPQLAVLDPTGDITDPPSDPNASDIITNEPDDATEKDKDAIIVLRVWAAEGNRAKYLIDPADPTMVSWSEANVNRAAVVIKTLLKDGVTYKQRRHAEDIDDPDAVFVDIQFHRRINKDLVWVKNVSLNEADREFSSTVDLAFVAGDTGSISDIASFVLSITQDGDDNRQALATLTIANGTVSGNAAVPKRVVIMRGKDENDNTGAPTTLAEINDGNAKWRPVFKKNLRADSDVLADVGTHTLTYTVPGVTSAKGIRYYRAFLFVVGDTTWVTDDDDNTGGADDGGISDTVVPGTMSAPTLRFRHGHLRIKGVRPSTGYNTIYQYEWQICSDSTYTGNGTRTFLRDNDTTPIHAPTVGNEETILTSGPKLSIPIKRKDFTDFPWASSNIVCKVRAYNQYLADPIGTYSADLTSAIGSAGASLDDPEDTAAPGACTFGRAKFKHGNLRVRCIRPTTQNNTIVAYHWIVSDSITPGDTSATYLQDSASGLEITAVSGDPTADRIVTAGPVLVLPVKKTTLTGMAATIYVHVVAQNLVGTGTSAATLTITTADLVSGVYNDDENIPVRRQFHGRGNLIDGGGCFNSALQFADPDNPGPLATELGRNVRIAIGGTRVATGSTPVSWTKNIHAITIATGASTATFFWRMKGQLVTGHKVALSFLYRLSAALAMTANTSFSMKATLVNSAGTDLLPAPGYIEVVLGYDTGGGTVELPWSTTFQTGVALMELDANPNTQLWLKLYDIPQFATRSLIFDDICVVRGTVPALWEPGQKEHYLDPDSGITVASTGYANTLNGAGLGSDGITGGGILTL